MDNDRDIQFDIVIGHHVHVAKKERGRIIIIIIMITRYDYNLTIMKSQVSQTGH
jgi:hypothetical protein